MLSELDFMKIDNEYYIYCSDPSASHTDREGLKQFRTSIHNLLLDLNKDLNYED